MMQRKITVVEALGAECKRVNGQGCTTQWADTLRRNNVRQATAAKDFRPPIKESPGGRGVTCPRRDGADSVRHPQRAWSYSTVILPALMILA